MFVVPSLNIDLKLGIIRRDTSDWVPGEQYELASDHRWNDHTSRALPFSIRK